MSYDVGQVVYLLSKKDSRIFPAKVVEQICRKTLDGEEISYVVQLPDKKSTCVSLESLSVDVFITLDSLQTHLLNEAMDDFGFIDRDGDCWCDLGDSQYRLLPHEMKDELTN